MENTLSFMLVDDSKVDLLINKKYVLKSAFAKEVVTYESPRAALSFLAENSEWPDIVLLDIRMNEMDGFEFLEHLESIQIASPNQTLRVFLVSSTLDFRDLSRAKANTIVLDLIQKPLNLEKLNSALQDNGLLPK
jgi:response regulator RpfG family c-di-GMP phosphodiesterase